MNSRRNDGAMINALATIDKVSRKIAPGRAPHFIEAHLVKALMTIGSESPVGRAKLARSLGLGEGSIRTLIKHLENEGLIQTSKEGMTLTGTGQRLVSSLMTHMSSAIAVPRSSLTVSAFNTAILVKDAASSVKAGLEQRDAAIRVGAQGATTLILSRGKLTMPSVKEDVFKDAPKIREIIVSRLKPQENDLVVIGSANDGLTAEFGAIAAALETLKAQ